MHLVKHRGIYHVRYFDGVSSRQKSLHTTSYHKARCELSRFQPPPCELPLVARNEGSRAPRTSDFTFRTWAQEYLRYSAGEHRPDTTARIHFALNEFAKKFGNTDLRKLTYLDFQEYKRLRCATRSPITVNTNLRHIKSFFSWLADSVGLLSESPMRKVKMLKVEKKDPVILRPEELPGLLSAIPDNWARDIVVLALLTGMRSGELRMLRWEDVDLERRLVFIASKNSKRRRDHGVPLNEQAVQLLRKKGRDSEWVFTVTRGENAGGPPSRRRVAEIITNARHKLGWKKKLKFHSLRHTFCTLLAEVEVPVQDIQILAGHTSIQTTMVYTHLAARNLHSVVAMLPTLPLGVPGSASPEEIGWR